MLREEPLEGSSPLVTAAQVSFFPQSPFYAMLREEQLVGSSPFVTTARGRLLFSVTLLLYAMQGAAGQHAAHLSSQQLRSAVFLSHPSSLCCVKQLEGSIRHSSTGQHRVLFAQVPFFTFKMLQGIKMYVQ
jgi:hypothetical protein